MITKVPTFVFCMNSGYTGRSRDPLKGIVKHHSCGRQVPFIALTLTELSELKKLVSSLQILHKDYNYYLMEYNSATNTVRQI